MRSTPSPAGTRSTSDRPWRSFGTRVLRQGLGPLISVGLLTALVVFFESDAMLERLVSASPSSIAIAIILSWISMLSTTLRYQRVLLHDLGRGLQVFLSLLRLNLLTNFLSIVFPISGAADVARAGFLWAFYGIGKARSLESVVHDRILALFVLVLLGLLSLPVQHQLGVGREFWLIELVVLVGLIAAILGALMLHKVPVAKWRLLERLARSVARFGSLVGSARELLSQLMLGLVYALCFSGAILVLGSGMGLSLSAALVLSLSPTLLVVQNLPFTYAGWGGREAVVVATLATSGTTPSDALALSIMLGLTITLSTIPGALVYAFGKPAPAGRNETG